MNVPKLRFKEFDGEWEVVTLGEISKLSSSKRIHLSDYVNKGIPFYRGSEISKGGVTGNQELFISRELYEKIKAKYGVPKFNDLLVSAVGTLGNLWKVDEREFYYKDGNLILISDLKADTDYIFSYFSDVFGKNRLIDSAAGSNQKALTMVKMRSVKVPLPSEKEQKKIGEFFGIMDKKIQLQQQKIDLLQEQKKGYMQKIFKGELRFKDGAGDSFDEWTLKSLNIIADKISKKNKDLKVQNVITNSASRGLISQNEYFEKDIANKNNIEGYYVIAEGDFVYNPRISSEAPCGPVNIYYGEEEGIVSPLYTCFRLKDCHKEFVHQYFKSTLWHKYIYENGDSGARHDRVSIKDSTFFEMPILLPCYEEQQKIAGFFEKFELKIKVEKEKLKELEEQKQGFMQQMFI